MHFPVERKQVVLTDGIERDILLDHHIAVARLELPGQRNRCVLRHPAKDLFAHSRNPVRRVLKTFPCGIFPDSFQEQGYCLFDFLFVHLTLSFRRVLSIGIQKKHLPLWQNMDKLSLHNRRCLLSQRVRKTYRKVLPFVSRQLPIQRTLNACNPILLYTFIILKLPGNATMSCTSRQLIYQLLSS